VKAAKESARADRIARLVACVAVLSVWAPAGVVAQMAASIPAGGGDLGNGGRTGAAAQEAVEADTLIQVTLAEALQRAAGVDPNYVAALRDVGDADWVRRQAWMAFLIPSIQFQWSYNRFSSPQFNIGTGELTDQLTTASLSGRYDLFRGGAKIFDMQRSAARVDGARAGELQARFQTALGTEADYYDVIAQTELRRVASERADRAEQQLAIARARVMAGAAVQTDSLQLLLELTRAQVELLQQESAVTVARLQLGRRIGLAGPADAAPLDTVLTGNLPISQEEAYREALSSSPRVEAVQADARVADALFKTERSTYFPTVSLFGQWAGFDEDVLPDATTRTTYGVALNFPIWDGASRELRVYRANTVRQVAEATRDDTEREVGRNIVGAYQAYDAARASATLAQRAVLVARETLRVQEERYQAGATTILDLLSAQINLAEAQAGLVQARFTTRLALAGVEAILGRRLFDK
jgi:outer membrane protein TolC